MRKTAIFLTIAMLIAGIMLPAPTPAKTKITIDDYCNRLQKRIEENGNKMPEDILHPKIAAKTWTKVKIMVCLLEFPDIKHQLQPEFVVSRVEGKGTNEPSLEEYYSTTSGGTFDLDFGPGVQPVWVKMPKAMSSYTMKAFDTSCIPALLKDSVDSAYNSGLKPEDYDMDGNGLPEYFIMIFGGNSWTTGGNVPGDFMTSYDGLTLIMMGEDVIKNKNYDLQLSPITFYHEFAHCMGICDLYDHEYKKPSPVGGWDIMGDGVWRGYCGMNAFNREKLGWCNIKEIKEPGIYTVMDLDSPGIDNKAYKILIPGGVNEYLIIENRQRVDAGYCKSSPGSGLVFYHLNGNREYVNNYNDTIPNKAIGIGVVYTKSSRYFADAFFSQDCGRDRLDITQSADVASWFTDKKEISLVFKNISAAGTKMTFELEIKKPIEPTIEVVNKLDFGNVRMGQKKTLPLNFFFTGKSGVRIDLSHEAKWVETDFDNFIGKNQTVMVTIDATQLDIGNHTCKLKFQNDFRSGNVEVVVQVKSVTGDTNSDLIVDDVDAQALFAAYGTKSDDISYQPDCDFNEDNAVDFEDVLLLAKFFGKDMRKKE